MKKILALLLVAIMCLSLVACGGGSSNTETPSSSENNSTENKFSVDLEGYVANVGNATALGIAQKQNSDVAPVMSKGGIELLSFVNLSSNEDTESKNYIVMSTTEYDANTPEADRNGLTKVTFTKTITENVTTETTGTKYITASEGQITILAVTGFTYTIYENDTPLYESVQDNDEIDTNDQDGVIVLSGLTDGTEYKVDYKGVGEEITITQDEINGEIDKLYHAGAYTFISFVPIGTSARRTKNTEYDRNGIDTYDRTGYESHEMRQSFVIDSLTGYIYPIKNFAVETIYSSGIIQSSSKYYKPTVNENGELVFTQFIQNTSLNVYRIYEDKFGQTFIYNDKLDAYDEENKTLYYTKRYYFLTEEGVVIYIKTVGETNGPDYHGTIIEPDGGPAHDAIKKMGENMSYRDIGDKESYQLIIPHSNSSGEFAEDCVIFGEISNGFLYLTPKHFNYSVCVNLSTLEFEQGPLNVPRYGWAASANQAVIAKNGNLYYGDIWGENSYQNGNDQNLTLLLADFGVVDNEYVPLSDIRFTQTTLTQTIYYQIIIDENGIPKAVNSETYVAPEKEVITLQPINK